MAASSLSGTRVVEPSRSSSGSRVYPPSPLPNPPRVEAQPKRSTATIKRDPMDSTSVTHRRMHPTCIIIASWAGMRRETGPQILLRASDMSEGNFKAIADFAAKSVDTDGNRIVGKRPAALSNATIGACAVAVLVTTDGQGIFVAGCATSLVISEYAPRMGTCVDDGELRRREHRILEESEATRTSSNVKSWKRNGKRPACKSKRTARADDQTHF